jgi:hypothetical protein
MVTSSSFIRQAAQGTWNKRALGLGIALALGVLGLGGRLSADELDIRDLQHEVLACQALHDDQALAKLQLVVKVRKRVATVAGAVPTRDLAQRAVACLKKLPDLIEVRDAMRVDNDDSVSASAPPISKGGGTIHSTGTLAKSRADLKKQEAAPATGVWKPVPGDKPIENIALLPAVTTIGPVRRSKDLSTKHAPEPPDAPAIISAVKNLMLSDQRFRGLRFEVKQNRVYLTGVVFRWADLHELSRAITRIPGVDGVVLQDVRDEPKTQ